MIDQALTHEELLTMRKAGKAAAKILKKIRKIISPGISTKEIERFFENKLKEYTGMRPAFKGFNDYPSSLCVSVNDEIIHGIPSAQKTIKEGDLVSVDLGIEYQGLFVDTAFTCPVGKVARQAKKLMAVARNALYQGIKAARVEGRIGDIGFTIQKNVEKNGFSVIKKFVGHGIGRKLHLPPEIPNFGKELEGELLKEGCALAIEPMVSAGGPEVKILRDGWTAKTKDDSLSAHFEHTVAVTKRGAWILTR